MEPDELDDMPSTVVTKDIDSAIGAHRSGLQMVVFGNGTFATHPLPDGGIVTIGRAASCDISVDDESISRRHAIVKVGETLTIEDLGSANGTRVRGNKLKLGHPTTISIGELVGLGNASMILQHRSRPGRPRMLWTHDYFEVRLEQECAREQRTGAPFALLHVQSDRNQTASFVEEALCGLVRDSDVVGKYGPHEYEVLLPDTPPDKAEEAVARIQGKLRELEIQCRMHVACCPRDGRSPYQLASRVNALAPEERPVSADIVVADPQMQTLYRVLEQVARSQLGVLLLGETGVGKEVFARAVHKASARSAGPFVEINCAALPETLLESELFGHEKGAFTNAMAAKPGLVEMADGGTLLLDEIGDMPLATQAKLLRVIEDAQLRRVGGLKSRSIDVRFVAATNADLETAMTQGTFRRDLYFRLNGVSLVIPPLRERRAELVPLALEFIKQASRGARQPVLTAEARDVMLRYSWPGNIRELKNVIERAVLLAGAGSILPEHLPVEKMRATRITGQMAAAVAKPGIPPHKGSAEEQQWIMQALERARGNQTVAARLLGISRRTLVNRLNDYQVQRPRKKRPPTKDE